MKISRIHHAAYRCKDAKETVEWYAKNLNMDFVLAIAEDLVPSTKAPVARTFMAFGTLTCPLPLIPKRRNKAQLSPASSMQ
jgi:catechol 2,3-dioxygenase-like lactoylglutathione lyase family enzyme